MSNLPKQIFIGSDHAGFNHKQFIVNHIKQNYPDIKLVDLGPETADRCDYPDYAAKVSNKVVEEEKNGALGILICGSGIGISISANKIKGVRCGLCHNAYTAEMTRRHNNANILALGERVVDLSLVPEIVDTFIKTEFEGKHHADRVQKIHALESN
ncbi:Ribose/galactose isomerase [Conidiobolus coronatus NRRL 28638]|uniref:Ribose/galactose isomerase n=1 Tax=Conidiobolus coronatus (strain ATCC 28846 / CBS 209.66 / NRRL 28638) TaxID=796925 RepID=A0A137NZ82_CONC2|nr:Ribose/galactose isomerase [Conidiobolus coronatus NRRL 28638]|eukprot:KXN68140.1 Ribose/galactose isomerase [Conidiobolus coronatus NRRL 28638]